MDDISNDLNQENLNNIVGEIDNGWFVQVTVFKTYSFKDEKVRTEYIKQGKDWIEEILKNTDFNECDDIKLQQNVNYGGLRCTGHMRTFVPLNPQSYAGTIYYIMKNKSIKISWKCILLF